MLHPFLSKNRTQKSRPCKCGLTLIITRESSANSKVRGKYTNAIHTLKRSIIGLPLSVQLRLHFLHSLSVADKESGLIMMKLTCYIIRNSHYTEKYFSLNTSAYFRNTSALYREMLQIYSALINYVFSNCNILKKNLHLNMQLNDMPRKLKVFTVFSEVSSAGFWTLSDNTSEHF